MYRKFPRLVLVAALAAGFGLAPMLSANAADTRGVDVYNPPKGFVTGNTANPTDITIYIGDSVSWRIVEGTHNITPVDPKAWGDDGSGDLTGDTTPQYEVHFTKVGRFVYYSKGEATLDNKNKCTGMCGTVNVVDPNATTTTTAAPTTTTTQAPTVTTQPPPPATTGTTAPTPAGVAGHVPTTAAPAPTTTSPTKPEKDKKPKDETSTTTTAPPALGPTNLGADNIVPNVAPGTVTQDGTVAPASTPTGEAVALLKEKHSTKGVKLLILTGLGIGALGFGTAGYKYAHRSSKYFPA